MMFVTICHRKIKTLEKSRVLDKLMTGIGFNSRQNPIFLENTTKVLKALDLKAFLLL